MFSRSLKKKINKKPALKIDSVICNGSHGKYIKYGSFSWSSVVATYDHKKLASLTKKSEI
jgi:hypothetical protein